MKSLKPSLREKKRYILIEGNNLKENIEKSILEFSGVLGLSQTGLNFIKSNKKSAVISVNRESLNLVRASFAVFRDEIKIRKVSGTLKGLGFSGNKK
ncbi:hypothetical protein K9L16_02015 [Candidatus Pacearchaeota archaeon]|nr:hypothetical protein [Candidatus Pacearchaeota archaeon]